MQKENTGRIFIVPPISLTFVRSVFDFNNYAGCFRAVMGTLAERRKQGKSVSLLEFYNYSSQLAAAMGFPSSLYTGGQHVRGQILIVQPVLTSTNEKYGSLPNPIAGFPDASVVSAIPFCLPPDTDAERLPRELVVVWACMLREFIFHTRPKYVVILNKKMIEIMTTVFRYCNLGIDKWSQLARGSNEKGVEVVPIRKYVITDRDVLGIKIQFVHMTHPCVMQSRWCTPKDVEGQSFCLRTLCPPHTEKRARDVSLLQTNAEVEEKKRRQRMHNHKAIRVQGQRNVMNLFSANVLADQMETVEVSTQTEKIADIMEKMNI